MNKKDRLVNMLTIELQSEITDLDDILNILGDSDSIIDSDSLSTDIKIMETKRNTYETIKLMIAKASLRIDGVENEDVMTRDEKHLFYKLVKITMRFRKLFRKSK